PSVDILIAIGACLGADLSVRYFPGSGPRLHDRFQAPMVEALIRYVGPAWRAQPAGPVPAARGGTDLGLGPAGGRLIIAVECHSELRRLELVMRRAAEKSVALAAQLGAPGDVSTILLLRSTRTTRAVATAFESTLAAAYPTKTRDAIAALRGDALWP